jgi:hypothetical protein
MDLDSLHTAGRYPRNSLTSGFPFFTRDFGAIEVQRHIQIMMTSFDSSGNGMGYLKAQRGAIMQY